MTIPKLYRRIKKNVFIVLGRIVLIPPIDILWISAFSRLLRFKLKKSGCHPRISSIAQIDKIRTPVRDVPKRWSKQDYEKRRVSFSHHIYPLNRLSNKTDPVQKVYFPSPKRKYSKGLSFVHAFKYGTYLQINT